MQEETKNREKVVINNKIIKSDLDTTCNIIRLNFMSDKFTRRIILPGRFQTRRHVVVRHNVENTQAVLSKSQIFLNLSIQKKKLPSNCIVCH